MTRRAKRGIAQFPSPFSYLGIGFAAGALTLAAAQGQFSGGVPTPAAVVRPDVADNRGTTSSPAPAAPREESARSVATTGAMVSGDIVALRGRDLDVPVEGVTRAEVRDTFHQTRGSSRIHEAVDILAPRNTPVHAVEDGAIARLFFSKAGGITVYQFDPTGTFCYYYAHLERYADGLTEGQPVRRGQLLGYVGTSGNAPKDTPHLHFAIFKLTPEKKWWEGEPLDPFLVFKP
jgi:murein DD-endopeptidase MepM/ murein hydrolase activator NlpD